MRQRNLNWLYTIIILAILLIIVAIIGLSLGEFSVPFVKVPSALFGTDGGIEQTIIQKLRLPRIILAIAIGGGLSLSGVILQGVFKNPLVEPYTLGISGGAALGVAIAIVLGLQNIFGSIMLPTLGFGGAIITIILVYTLSIRNGRLKIEHMLLIGVMISFVASSGMMLLMSATSTENLHGIIFWVMGSLDEPNSKLITYASVFSILGLIASYFFVQPLNALRLGENKARSLGINTDLTIKLLFIIASILTGVCVSVAGVIGFVGLIIPHLIRLFVGTDYRILLISSFISGGIFLIISDTIARTIISPNELPIGVITGIFGGIIFIVVLGRNGLRKKLK